MMRRITNLFEKTAFHYVTICSVILLIFGQVLSFPLLWWDDRQHICQNIFINQGSLSGLIHIWSKPYFGLYAPLSYSVWMILVGLTRLAGFGNSDCLQWGLLFHSVNLALHAVNSCLVYLLLKRRVSPTASLFGAILFAVHPLQVESVAWASAMRDLLSALLGLSAILAFQVKRWKAGTVLVLASCLAKASGIIFPLLFLLIELFETRNWRSLKGTAYRLVPSVGLALIMGIVTKLIQPDSLISIHPRLWERPLIFVQAIGFYFWKWLVPTGLTIDYGRSVSMLQGHPQLYWTSVLFFAFLFGCTFFRSRVNWFCILWVVIAVLPVSGLLSFGYEEISTVADRYSYVALFGPVFVLVNRTSDAKFFRQALIALIGLFAIISVRQTSFWKNDQTLFTHNIEQQPNSSIAHDNLAYFYYHKNLFKEAELEVRLSLKLNPANAQALLLLANLFDKQGSPQQAENIYKEAIGQGLAIPEMYNNLGAIEYRAGDSFEAEAHWKIAAKADPYNMKPWYNLGQLFLSEKKWDLAAEAFGAASRLAPQDSRPLMMLKYALEQRDHKESQRKVGF